MRKSFSTTKLLLNGLALVSMVIMVRLGIWQLDRSEFKAEKQTVFTQRAAQPVQELPTGLVNKDDWSYYNVQINGQYQADDSFFVDNVVNNTVTGLLLVTPLRIANSEHTILITRGWLPWGVDRTFLPAIQTPDEKVTLTGLLVPAAEKHFYLNDPDKSDEPDNLWLQLDLKRFMELTDYSMQPLILVLDSGQPGSYERIWQLQDDSWVARHKAYAVQWFGLALMLLIITLVLNFRSSKGNTENG